MAYEYNSLMKGTEEEKVQRCNDLIEHWRETKVRQRIRPCFIIPDTTNRSRTGLSVKHVHYIANLFQANGFHNRFDVPVLVHHKSLPPRSGTDILTEGIGEENLGYESYTKWTDACQKEGHLPFPSFSVHLDDYFTSLGNGHFFQALNCYQQGKENILFDGVDEGGTKKYCVGDDAQLNDAIHDGVLSIILRHQIPRKERMFISEILNSSHNYGYGWVSQSDGSMTLQKLEAPRLENTSFFQRASKSMDSIELTEMVRLEMKWRKQATKRHSKAPPGNNRKRHRPKL